MIGFMLRHPKAAYVGVAAALRTPGWISGSKLRTALNAEVINDASAERDASLEAALRIANGTLRQLSRTHTAWKNTCLYRSMAQYLVLREYDRSAAIRIGVSGAPAHTDDRGVAAHSWVVYHGPEQVEGGGEEFEVLRFGRAAP